jgi:dihydrofolate reductase
MFERNADDVHLFTNLDSAVGHSFEAVHRSFLIGGSSLYSQALKLPVLDRILLTRIISPEFGDCNTFIPDIQSEWRQSTHAELSDWVGFTVPEGQQEENGVKYEFQMWVRRLS